MALTKVSGSILKDPLNLGEVSIGGTLTYEDVTNVDSLGIGTFRAGINVSGGQLDVGSNIKLGNAGVITATSYRGDGSQLTGIAVGGASSITFNDDVGLFFGTGNSNGRDLQIVHEPSAYVTSFKLEGHDAQFSKLANNNKVARFSSTGVAYLYYDNSIRLETNSSGMSLSGDVSIVDKIVHTGDTNTAIRFPAADTIAFETSGGERLRINNNGRVGVGTDSPLSVLSAYGENRGEGTVTGQIAAKDNAAYNASPTAGLVFMGHYAANNAQAIFAGITGFKENANDGNYAGALALHTRANGSVAQERLRIDAGGGVQIGTSTATASKVTVYGANDAAAIFQGSSTGTGAGNGLLVGNNGGTTGLLWNYENGPVKIAAQNAERVRIETDGSCYFGPQIITEADMNWGHDAHQRPFVFSGNQSGVNPADATIVVANPNTNPSATRLGSFMFGCKTSSGGNSGIKAYIEGWTTSNPSNAYEAGGYIKFVTRQSAGSLTEHFKIDHDGKLYKSGNHFYPLVNYTEVTTFSAVSTSSSSYTDLRTILSNYSPKKAGNLIVIHHQSQLWQGGNANDSGDAMWKIQRQEGGGSWTDVTENDRILGNMDGRNYTGGSGLARHHRTVHLMGSFICNGSSFNLKSLGKVDFTNVGLQWYHHSFNILQVWEYEKG